MKKDLKKLKYLEEQSVYNELSKIENAEKYYKNYLFFNSTSLMLFIMSLIIIITACFYQVMLINTNELLISFVTLIFVVLSFVSLIVSMFYNSKTMNLVKKYYSKC